MVATNRNLEKMVQEGQFREDFYYRLNILNIKAPALREHLEDIPELVGNILNELFVENGIRKSIAKDAIEIFQQYNWPGNVRELNNIIAKLYYMSDGSEITSYNIPRHILYANNVLPASTSEEGMDHMVEELEKHLVIETLKKTNNNITKTANILKISRPRLYRIMEKIPPEEFD